MNNSVIIGRLTRDPEIRQGQKGEIASFTVAVDRFAKDDDADYIPVTCFGKQAEYVSNYLGKGRLVAVAGRIKTGSYEKDGQKRYTWEVVAQTVHAEHLQCLDHDQPSTKTDVLSLREMSAHRL